MAPRIRLLDIVTGEELRTWEGPADRLNDLIFSPNDKTLIGGARQLLERLAKGRPEAFLTHEAKASLDRLAKRAATRP